MNPSIQKVRTKFIKKCTHSTTQILFLVAYQQQWNLSSNYMFNVNSTTVDIDRIRCIIAGITVSVDTKHVHDEHARNVNAKKDKVCAL